MCSCLPKAAPVLPEILLRPTAPPSLLSIGVIYLAHPTLTSSPANLAHFTKNRLNHSHTGRVQRIVLEAGKVREIEVLDRFEARVYLIEFH